MLNSWCFSRNSAGQKGMAAAAAADAKSLQSCPTLCDPIDGSPPGSPVPGILQARTLEWVAISFSNAWKWKVKVKLLSRVRLLASPWTAAYQAFQARVLECSAITFSEREWQNILKVLNGKTLQPRLLYPATVLVTELCLTLCDPTDWNPPGSSVHAIFQARITGVGSPMTYS